MKLEQAGDSISAFIGLWMLAEVQRGIGKVDASLATHERALTMLHDAALPTARFTMGGLKFLGPAVGLDPTGLGPIVENPQILKPMMLSMAETIGRDSYAHLLINAGKLERAETELTRAAAIAPLFGGMFDSSIEGHFGDLRRRQWHFDEARAHYRRALEGVVPITAISGRDEWLRVSILGNLADIELLSGCTDEALAWNDQALAMVRASKNRHYEASLRQDRGSLLVRGGRLSDAETAFEDALVLAELLDDHARQASILSDLGWLHVWRGEYGTAIASLEKSIELFQNEKHTEEEAATWIALAEVYTFLDSPDTARQAVEKATVLAANSNLGLAKGLLPTVEAMSKWDGKKESSAELMKAFTKYWELPELSDSMVPDDVRLLMGQLFGPQGGDVHEINTAKVASTPIPILPAMALLMNGKRLFMQGDIAGARALWLKAIDANPNKDLRAGYLALVGATFWKEDRRKEAVRYFELAAQAVGTTLRDIKVEELLAGYLGSSRQWIFDVTIEALVQDGRIEDAFDHTESARARAFLQSMGNARLQPARGTAGGMVREAEALRRSIAGWERQSVFASKEATNDLQHARERYQALLTRLKAANPEYASLTTVEPLRAADVRRALPDDTALVSYFVIGGRVHAWIVDRDRLEHVALRSDQTQLDRAVCWAIGLGGGSERGRSMSPERPDCPESATPEEVYELLFAPLRAKIRVARLIVVPHGDLHYIPFAALRDPRTKRYLLEDYTLSYSPSASALKYLAEKESPVEGRALVIGNPMLGQAQAALPGAQREATAIARLFGTEPKVGAAATEGLLYGIGGKYDLIHIGAHGEYRAGSPLYSRIALARDATHDGNLEVQEILSDVDFSGVNLVVLSACETARGRRSGGDEIVGLTRARAAGKSLSSYLAGLVVHEVAGEWPEGFFEEIVGGWKGEPLQRPKQGRAERRDRL